EDQVRWRPFARRLLHHAGDREHLALLGADADDAVLVDAFRRHFLDGDDVRGLTELLGGVDHLRQAAALVLDEDVGKEQRERFIADELACAPDRMAEPERLLLAGKTCGGALAPLLMPDTS